MGIWGILIRGAKERNIPFLITREEALALFVQQDRKCALTGLKLKLNRDSNEPYSATTASLDRIDSSKGYTIDNVQWVHKVINIMKNDHSQSEFVDWCRKVVNFAGIKI